MRLRWGHSGGWREWGGVFPFLSSVKGVGWGASELPEADIPGACLSWAEKGRVAGGRFRVKKEFYMVFWFWLNSAPSFMHMDKGILREDGVENSPPLSDMLEDFKAQGKEGRW